MPAPVPIRKAVEALLNHLKILDYSRFTVALIQTPLNKVLLFAENKGVKYFSHSLMRDFLRAMEKNYNPPPGGYRMRKDTEHAVRILSEFVATGEFRYKKYGEHHTPLPRFMEQAMVEANAYAETKTGWSKSHVRGQRLWIRRFMEYATDTGLAGWSNLTAKDISGWLISMGKLSRATRCAAFTAIQHLLKCLFRNGKLQRPLHDNLRAPRRGDDRQLAHIWTDEEIHRVFSVIERDRPEGKRDYAMLMLSLRLALRSSDITHLTLDDVFWRKAEMSFVQRKTRKRLSLPLPDDVASALVEYLRHARPETSFREIFLRFKAPHRPLTSGALAALVVKYRQRAGLDFARGCGMHSLRHTVATRLMADSVRMEEISAVLGHSRLDTTLLYLRASLPLLAQAGLDPEVEAAHA